MRPCLLVALSAVILAQPALAGAPPVIPSVTPLPVVVAPPPPRAAVKPDEATIAEALRLLDTDDFDNSAVHSTELMVGMHLAGMVDQMHKMFGDKVPSDLIEELRTTIHDHAIGTMRTHLKEMKREAAEIYAEQFTKAELIHLRELHSDPVAVKARERAKVMEPKLIMIGVKTMRDAQPELDAKIKRVITDYVAAHGGATKTST